DRPGRRVGGGSCASRGGFRGDRAGPIPGPGRLSTASAAAARGAPGPAGGPPPPPPLPPGPGPGGPGPATAPGEAQTAAGEAPRPPAEPAAIAVLHRELPRRLRLDLLGLRGHASFASGIVLSDRPLTDAQDALADPGPPGWRNGNPKPRSSSRAWSSLAAEV